jgi:mycothiol system anti-sigma-R factor
MNCKNALESIPAYVDGEFDAAQADAIEAHLRGCTECTRVVEAERGWRRTVRAGATRYAAPDRLRARLAVSLAEADAAMPAAAPRFARWRPLAMAASLALAVIASSGLTTYVMQPAGQDRLVEDVVSGHVRSLMAGHLTDILSSDQHAVKPWFHGRIDLAPPVDDLAGDGYPLVGGRLDYLDQRPVAALVYRRREHPINLFVMAAPSGQRRAPASLAERGYNVVHWSERGMSFWAVSDLALAELKEFARLYQSRSALPAS